MKKLTLFFITALLSIVLLLMPLYVVAQTTPTGEVTGQSLGLFPCNGVVDLKVPGSKECTFADIIALANKIINALFVIIMIIAPVLIARAGYYYVISSDKPAERSKANGQLTNLVIGLVIVACAYFIVKLVLNVLIGQSVLQVTF